MRLFLDENVQQSLVRHLQQIFGQHEFFGVADLETKGVDDVALFEMVATAGCQIFITCDRMQMQRPDEREACRDAGLHWIGVHQVNRSGYHSLAGPASTLIHALPFVFDAVSAIAVPQYFQLKKSERNGTRVFEYGGAL